MNPRNTACVLCKCAEDDYGGLQTTKGTTAHYYCLLLSQTITQSGGDSEGILGFLKQDIVSDQQRSKHRRCCYCTKLGASLGCAYKTCKYKYHLPCVLKHRTSLNFKNFTSYCSIHHKRSNVPSHIKKNINTYRCVICMDTFSGNIDYHKIIWATCCKASVLLHRHCVQIYALSAGYFVKCPGCNNRPKFVNIIKLHGVFVPERDASWELEKNAYADLYNRHNTCDAIICKNPDGRNHSTTRGKWKYFLCKYCGSYGTHQNCSKVKQEFVCPTCTLKETESDHRFTSQNSFTSDLEQNYNLEKTVPTQNNSSFELGKSSKTVVNKDYVQEDLDLIKAGILEFEAANRKHGIIFNINASAFKETNKTLVDNFNNSKLGRNYDLDFLELDESSSCEEDFDLIYLATLDNEAAQAKLDKNARLNGIINKLQEKLKGCNNSI